MSTMLAFAHADVGYGSTRVLTGASLAVHTGEVVGLVGPNGAGKSTLLRAITGTADVLAGSLSIAGLSIERLSPRQRALQVAVVPQAVSATFAFSARQFVEMGRHPHLTRFQQPGEHDAEVVERAMRLTDTWRLAATRADTLSGGDLQRLVLAQALAQEPRLLLLDEPVSQLDLNHRLQVLELVRSLADNGLAVLAVFHDLDSAARYGDRIAVVSRGRVSRADEPSAVITPETLRDVFGVRAVVGSDPITGSVSVTPVLRDEAMPRPARARGRVLIVAGSGSGAGLMRRLSLAGYEVTASALNAGDVDQSVASALGLEHVTLPPYAAMDDPSREAVKGLAATADAIVVAAVPFGAANVDNLRLAVEAERPLVLVGQIEGRDFAGGRAGELWDRAREEGALTAVDDDGALRRVEELLGCSPRPE